MPWKRSDSKPMSDDTYWRDMGCCCCSTARGFDQSEYALHEIITVVELEQIVVALETQLGLARQDLRDMLDGKLPLRRDE